MSKTNSQVAAAFVRQQHVENKNGNMSVVRDNPYPVQTTPMETTPPFGNFVKLAHLYSYSTVIARTVQNMATGKKELWITPRYFSSTTQRHKNHVLRAFWEWCATNGQDDSASVFYTAAGESGWNPSIARTDAGLAQLVLKDVSANMINADKPRLRENTRRGVLHSGLKMVRMYLTHLTLDVPIEHQDSETVTELQDMHEFLSRTVTLELVELRAAVRAYTTLTTVGND